MFPIGTLLYFTPFYFKDGSSPKNKYFLVLDYVDGEMIVAGLPSSKDHSPAFIPKKHGCMHDEGAAFIAYYFEAGKTLLDNDWRFDKPTFLYAFFG